MDVKTIDLQQHTKKQIGAHRPLIFEEFVGQEETKKIIQAAIKSAQTRQQALGHTLFSGQSGYGKTTLAQIVASQMGASIKIITGYAITKPADMVSLLNSLGPNDILFIDEIHRLRSSVEEVLYIAMEDYCIDMVMPDGGSIRIPLDPFTLIGATTTPEKLTPPLKNRFVYKFHFNEYTPQEKQHIIGRYISYHQISLANNVLDNITEFVPSVPREIANTCIQLNDYLVAHYGEEKTRLEHTIWQDFLSRRKLSKGGVTSLHQSYINILTEYSGQPVGLKTLAVKLGMSEQAVEEDIEPLLFKMNKIMKTARGRVLI